MMTAYRFGEFTEADARLINHQRVTITTHAERETGQPARTHGPRYALHVPGKPYVMLLTAKPTEATLDALLRRAIVVFLTDIASVTVHRSVDDGAAIVLHPDGTIARVELPADPRDQLAVMYRALDCDRVDVVRLSDRINMWLDDDGMDSRPVNPIATTLAQRYGFTFQDYYGPVMFTGVDVSTGDSRNLTTDQAKALMAHLNDNPGRGSR